MIRAWLSRQRNGSYMLTAAEPILCMVRGTDYQDYYVRQGDPIGYRNMCAEAVALIWGVSIDPLCSVRVWVDGGTFTNQIQEKEDEVDYCFRIGGYPYGDGTCG